MFGFWSVLEQLTTLRWHMLSSWSHMSRRLRSLSTLPAVTAFSARHDDNSEEDNHRGT